MIYLILFFGLILRLISLNQSLWLDEATSALVARMNVADIFGKFLPGDFHPPLYYLLLHWWSVIFGSGEVVLRLLSVLVGVITIYIVYKLAGKLPALLLATSGLHIYYSQEARMYALATLFVTLAVFSFVKIIKADRVGDWIVFSVFLFLIGATDYVALFILPVFWILGKRFWKKLFVSHIILLVFGFGWLPYLLKQLNVGLSVKFTSPAWWQILGASSFKQILLVSVKFMIGRISFDNGMLYASVVLLTTVLFGYLLLRARKANKVFWLWLFVPVVLGIGVSFWIPTLSYFRYLFVLPAFYILVSYGIKSRWLVFLVIGINLLTSGYYLFSPRFHREGWREAAQALGSSKIVFPADSQKEALIYYGKGGQIISPDEVDKKDKEIWLSRYVWEVFDPTDAARIRIESLGYRKLNEYNFNGVVFFKYAHSN